MNTQAATSKTTGDINSQSGKQDKLSNTDTKHSTNLSGQDSPHSQKGENTPESAKMKGTVDVRRPQK